MTLELKATSYAKKGAIYQPLTLTIYNKFDRLTFDISDHTFLEYVVFEPKGLYSFNSEKPFRVKQEDGTYSEDESYYLDRLKALIKNDLTKYKITVRLYSSKKPLKDSQNILEDGKGWLYINDHNWVCFNCDVKIVWNLTNQHKKIRLSYAVFYFILIFFIKKL